MFTFDIFEAVVFVYDYYPGLETLQQRLYSNPNFNLKGWANPYNLDGTARPYSAGKGKISLFALFDTLSHLTRINAKIKLRRSQWFKSTGLIARANRLGLYNSVDVYHTCRAFGQSCRSYSVTIAHTDRPQVAVASEWRRHIRCYRLRKQCG